MPWHEDSFGPQHLLSSEDGLDEHIAFMRDMGMHVIDQEWLSEVVLIVGVGHGLEMQGHRGSRLHIPDLVVPGGSIGIGIEESGRVGSVLGEVRVRSALIPLLVVVNHMEGLWSE